MTHSLHPSRGKCDSNTNKVLEVERRASHSPHRPDHRVSLPWGLGLGTRPFYRGDGAGGGGGATGTCPQSWPVSERLRLTLQRFASRPSLPLLPLSQRPRRLIEFQLREAGQPAQSHPALAGNWNSVSPGLCCFSSSASLCPLPGGSWGQEITEFPSLSFFPPVFFQPHSNSMPFPRAVFHQLGLSSPQVLACCPPLQSPAAVAFLPR